MRDQGLADLEGETYPDLIPENKELLDTINRFTENGFGALVVGGAVRDCVL